MLLTQTERLMMNSRPKQPKYARNKNVLVIGGSGEKSGEDFWVKSERLLYCALIGYIHYEVPEAEKNFTTLLEMINASEACEDDAEFQSPVDLMFERLEEKAPEYFAVKQYKKFLLSAGKTIYALS